VRAEAKPFLFVGPSLATSPRGRSLARAAFQVRRPIRRGDVEALLARHRRGTLVIVDGVFHDTLAVGHAEIREALTRGWRVWGVSSMGAIRAREMAHLGVRGYGSVYARFAADADFQDDEVALLHEPSAPYKPVSEPLVHLRVAVEHLVARRLVAAGEGSALVAELKGRWYGERSVRRLSRSVEQALGPRASAAVAELRDFERFRVKTLDAERFLFERPDLSV
jgi:hypothetical protein